MGLVFCLSSVILLLWRHLGLVFQKDDPGYSKPRSLSPFPHSIHLFLFHWFNPTIDLRAHRWNTSYFGSETNPHPISPRSPQQTLQTLNPILRIFLLQDPWTRTLNNSEYVHAMCVLPAHISSLTKMCITLSQTKPS